jgi:hypothetical protein
VNALTLAAVGMRKQYCLRRTKDDELYCVSKRKSMSPKIFCSLDFLFLFYQEKRKEVLLFEEDEGRRVVLHGKAEKQKPQNILQP